MTVPDHVPDALADHAATLPWRRRALRRAGFERRLAAQIAADDRYDLHAVLALTDRGCPPRIAARILAPLETNDP
jgi:hypothetical protein